MSNIFIPRYVMDHKLPLGSFWRHMSYNGRKCDVYFWKDGLWDSYMCRYSDEPSDYSSGKASDIICRFGFMDSTSMEQRVEIYENQMMLAMLYLEWKGLRESHEAEMRDTFKEARDAKHIELSPIMER